MNHAIMFCETGDHILLDTEYHFGLGMCFDCAGVN